MALIASQFGLDGPPSIEGGEIEYDSNIYIVFSANESLHLFGIIVGLIVCFMKRVEAHERER